LGELWLKRKPRHYSTLARRAMGSGFLHSTHPLVDYSNHLAGSEKFCLGEIPLIRNTSRAVNHFSGKFLP
jgi:hypothetical protein